MYTVDIYICVCVCCFSSVLVQERVIVCAAGGQSYGGYATTRGPRYGMLVVQIRCICLEKRQVAGDQEQLRAVAALEECEKWKRCDAEISISLRKLNVTSDRSCIFLCWSCRKCWNKRNSGFSSPACDQFDLRCLILNIGLWAGRRGQLAGAWTTEMAARETSTPTLAANFNHYLSRDGLLSKLFLRNSLLYSHKATLSSAW